MLVASLSCDESSTGGEGDHRHWLWDGIGREVEVIDATVVISSTTDSVEGHREID